MRHVNQHGSKMILYSDGGQGWKSVCTKKKIILEVVHGKLEFLRKVKTRKKASGVACAGTQCIDRFWQGLDDFIPVSVMNKQKGKLNTRLLTYVYSYMWHHVAVPLAGRCELPDEAGSAGEEGQTQLKGKKRKLRANFCDPEACKTQWNSDLMDIKLRGHLPPRDLFSTRPF